MELFVENSLIDGIGVDGEDADVAEVGVGPGRGIRLNRWRGRAKIDGEPEGGTVAVFTFDADIAAHQFDEAFADGQAEPGAAEFTSGGGIDLGEAFEETVDAIGRDADAGVLDGESENNAVLVAAFEGGADGDGAGGSEFQGVVDEIHEDLANAGGIAHQAARNIGAEITGEGEVLFGGGGAEKLGEVFDQFVEFKFDVFDFDLAGLDL